MRRYDNADVQKLLIVSENKGKSGVYRWINKVNGKTYIGSSANLGLSNYLSYISSGNMSINKALIKYGYSNFTLDWVLWSERYISTRAILSWSL